MSHIILNIKVYKYPNKIEQPLSLLSQKNIACFKSDPKKFSIILQRFNQKTQIETLNMYMVRNKSSELATTVKVLKLYFHCVFWLFLYLSKYAAYMYFILFRGKGMTNDDTNESTQTHFCYKPNSNFKCFCFLTK